MCRAVQTTLVGALLNASCRSLLNSEQVQARLSRPPAIRDLTDRPTATAAPGKRHFCGLFAARGAKNEGDLPERLTTSSLLSIFRKRRQEASNPPLLCRSSPSFLHPPSDPTAAAACRVINFHQTRSLPLYSEEFFPAASALRSVDVAEGRGGEGPFWGTFSRGNFQSKFMRRSGRASGRAGCAGTR